jgi:regulator of replication initiation timing
MSLLEEKDTQKQQQPMNPSEKRSNRKLLISGLLVILISINGILLYMNYQKKEKNEEQEEVIKVKDKELENQIKVYEALKADFERQSQELQAMGLENDSLEAQIASISNDLNELRGFRKSSYSLADQRRFRDRAQAFEEQLKVKDKEIATLKKDNEVLFTENTTLKTTQNRLSDSLTTMKSTNENLTEKVKVASKLEAQSLNVYAVNKRGKELDDRKNEFKQKNIEKIRLTFNLGKNDVAPREPKTIYMRLIEPDGAALYNLSTGSGSFDIEGQDMYYTAKRDIVFDNTQQQVSFVYAKNAEYKKGQHTIELYADGFMIGSTTFVLK